MHFVCPNVTYFCICEQIQVGANILKRNDSWSAKFYPPRAFILSPDAHLWVGAVGALKQHLLLRIRGLEISWTFLQCVFSGVSSKCLHRMICSHSGCLFFNFLHWCTSLMGPVTLKQHPLLRIRGLERVFSLEESACIRLSAICHHRCQFSNATLESSKLYSQHKSRWEQMK